MAQDPTSRPALSLVQKDAASAFYARRALELGGPVLILGSANGRIACEVGIQGPSVVGVEPSQQMLEEAVTRRAAESPELLEKVSFIQADVRSLRLGKRFPVVLAPQNAFGLVGSLEELEQLLATARAHLTDDGAFLFDVSLPHAATFSPQPEAGPGRPDPLVLPPRAVFVPHLRDRRREGKEKRSADEGPAIHRLRLHQFLPHELDEAVTRAGFTALEKFGSFEGKPYDPADALMIVVAAKT